MGFFFIIFHTLSNPIFDTFMMFQSHHIPPPPLFWNSGGAHPQVTDSDGSWSHDALLAGLKYVATKRDALKIVVINLSLGGGAAFPVGCDFIEEITTNRGIVVVGASGEG